MTLPLIALLATMPTARDINGFDSARLAAIPQRMGEFVQAGAVAGTVVLVKRHGKTVLFDAQGSASLNPKRPMRTDTIFQIMSMTKPVTAIAIVMCAEAGLLNLDDPVDKHLPAFRDLKVKGPGGKLIPASSRPTIRQLLTHTAGFGSDDPAHLDDDSKRRLDLASYADLLASEPLVGQPGERIRYSGPGFSALGRIVEVVAKMPLERFEEERIFRPLGMKDTFFFAPEDRYPRIAETYMRTDQGKLIPFEPDPFRRGAHFANPAGGLYSTAEDMAALLQCIADGGSKGSFHLLSPAGIDAMTAIQTGNLQMDGSDAQAFGLGFAIVKSPVGQMSLKPIGSFGHTGAFGTEFWTDRKRGIVTVFMAQGLENVSEVRKTFNTMVNAAFVGP